MSLHPSNGNAANFRCMRMNTDSIQALRVGADWQAGLRLDLASLVCHTIFHDSAH